eukprot:1126357-Alexandrium_andersonii.AAC.1
MGHGGHTASSAAGAPRGLRRQGAGGRPSHDVETLWGLRAVVVTVGGVGSEDAYGLIGDLQRMATARADEVGGAPGLPGVR